MAAGALHVGVVDADVAGPLAGVAAQEPVEALEAPAERPPVAAGTQVGVFFQNRTAPDIAWLKRLVETGGLGRVFLASAQVKWYRPPEYYGNSRWRGT